MANIKKVAVLGSGTMGVDLAILCSKANLDVFLWHRNDTAIAEKRLKERIKKYESRGILSTEAIKRIETNTKCIDTFTPLADTDLIIECIAENIDAKERLFRQLAESALPNSLITTNTSSFSVERLAKMLPKNYRFAGLHFFNPALRMDLVEIVSCSRTDFVMQTQLSDFCTFLNKTAVHTKDTPGFIINRLMVCQLNQAIKMVEQDISSSTDIDHAVKMGLLHPLGPLQLADLVGLDVLLSMLKSIYDMSGDSAYEPPELLLKMVRDGKLGRKTGEGFYSYEIKKDKFNDAIT